jgi:hypothetical protein
MKQKKEYVQQPLFDTAPLVLDMFATQSPINEDKITGQNRTIYEYLKRGKTLTSMEAIKKWGITRLGARVWDLRHIAEVIIYDRMIKEAGADVKQYSMNEFPENALRP